MSTDRSSLEGHKDDFYDFLDKLSSMSIELTKHHFTAKNKFSL